MILGRRIPGDRCPEGLHPNLRPHVLVITEPEPGEKEWEIEHHPECPVVCAWYPPKDGQPWFAEDEGRFPLAQSEREGHRVCYVQWEIDANGIDCLAVVSHRERGPDGEWRDVAPYADPGYVPETQFEAEWKRLRPGRYLIEGWFTPQGWAGSEPVDADGGLTIIGLAADTPPV